MTEDKDNCEVCGGTGKGFNQAPCAFCNGTGEWTEVGAKYFKNHICQCIHLDRQWCPVCGQKCHHDASLSPKQKIEPGGGGLTTDRGITDKHKQDKEVVIV